MREAIQAEPDGADPEFVERLRAIDEMYLPPQCTHDEALELYRRSPGAAGGLRRLRRPAHCRQCGHALPKEEALRARDIPGLTHAVLFFVLSWGLYLLNPYPPLRAEVAMWVTWVVCFAVGYRLRTPFRSARNALLILFSISWLVFIARYWSVVTPGYFFMHTLWKWADCVFATTPVFASVGARALIDNLKSRARERVDDGY